MDRSLLPSEALLDVETFDDGGAVRGIATSRGRPSTPADYGALTRRDIATDVYNAFRRQGFSHQQAMALAAEINRENVFNPTHLFGTHRDPHNRATNVGMLSWQGDRAARLLEFMGSQGLLDEQGRIRQTPEALDAQAAYLRWEMENLPEYARTRERFLANPDIDPDTAHRVLGDNFIRWRRTDPEYSGSGYARINEGYRLLTGDETGGSPDPVSPLGGLRPRPRPDREARGPLDDLTDALGYLQLAEGPPELSPGSPPPVHRPRRSDTGARALQRMGIASLA